jgi:F-type H+-transporting ATPase subunit b
MRRLLGFAVILSRRSAAKDPSRTCDTGPSPTSRLRMTGFVTFFLLMLVPAVLMAQQKAPTAPDNVAHGSEKVSHEVAHPNEEHGDAETEPKFLGLPAWIFKLINMLLFIGVLGWLIGGPIKRALADRGAGIRKAADAARERRAKADQVATDIQARLAQLEEEVRTIAERAKIEGERQKRDLIAAADTEAAKILASARTEVDNRLKNARRELTEYAGQLASERAEQIMRDGMTDEDRARIFRESLREVEEVKS